VSEWIDRTAVFVVALATERVEGHRDVRRVALAFLDELPVVEESGDEANVVFHPAVRDVAGFDQVDDAEKHQRLVRGRAAIRRAGDVEIGEFTEPVVAVHRRAGGRRVSGKSGNPFARHSAMNLREASACCSTRSSGAGGMAASAFLAATSRGSGRHCFMR